MTVGGASVGPGESERAATLLAATRLGGPPFERLPAACRPADLAAAYRVQERLHQRLSAAGLGPIVGHKIGCTTPVMQRFLAIDHPCAGGIFATTVQRDHGTCRHGAYHRIGVECEIAVRLATDLEPATSPHERHSVAAAVAACMAAIELVDDRYLDYRSLDTPTLVADDFFNAGCVLGPSVPNWQELDLASLTGRMTIDGTEVGRGQGKDILGHPLDALAWLANALNARGDHLRAGEFVLLGSVVQTQWVGPGARVAIEIEHLGSATCTFT